MPIYAYKCESCGYAKDALQKMSDAPLTDCPQCGKPSFKKQVTAAGFQLKGSGWYVTDFRGGDSGAAAKVGGAVATESKSADAAAAPAASTVATPAAPTAAPASGDTSSKSS
ncbi:MAG: FmdB family zinc ribbon protein [Polaromonas sp.]